jgi:uncharacterized protein
MDGMVIREMSNQECAALLARSAGGRLGCALDNQPYVVPVSIAYEEGYVYSFSTLGQKIDWLRENPKACMQVDEITDASTWTSVIAVGTYQELKEPQFELERARARKLLDRSHQWWLNALAERHMKTEGDLISPIFFRIVVDSMSGLTTS